MVHAAIGGMQLKHWTGYFRIILPTLKVLKEAKRTEGCVHAETFKAGDVYFAVSVWETREQMQSFARSGLHGRLVLTALDEMALFYNYSTDLEAIPDRNESEALWREAIAARNYKGTVGTYSR